VDYQLANEAALVECCGNPAKALAWGPEATTTLADRQQDQDAETGSQTAPRSLSMLSFGPILNTLSPGSGRLRSPSGSAHLIAADTTGRVCYGLFDLNPAYSMCVETVGSSSRASDVMSFPLGQSFRQR